MNLGISGRLTRAFIDSPLTPLLLLAALIVGGLALLSLPREEEPQISVPMVDIMVTANGYKAGDAVELITKPLEDIIKAINGVEHVYSVTADDSVVTTARFFVGTDEDTALLRVHEKIRANIVDLPKGIPEPVIIGRGINDVVDFIQHRRAEGSALRQALLEAGTIRFKPIFLTATATMIGAAFIMADPIFQGLAISLVFGLASSTALTVLVIPCVYVWLRDDEKEVVTACRANNTCRQR